VQSGYFLLVFVRDHGRLRPRLPAGELRALLRSSGTFFLSLVGNQVLLNVSFLALGLASSHQSLGLYTAAQRLAFGVFAAFGVLLGQAFFPVLSRQFASRGAAVVRTMRVFWAFAFAGAAAVAAIGIGLSAPVMQWVYSASFRSASPVFAMLMASAALVLLESPRV
jgi:O-antigen/teichoic acid export membrane protein